MPSGDVIDFRLDGTDLISAGRHVYMLMTPISSPEYPQWTTGGTYVLEVADLELAPGQKLVVGVKAADRYALTDKPHVGLGQRYELQSSADLIRWNARHTKENFTSI